MRSPVLLIACGALAREIVELKQLNNWTHLKIKCLPAELHNRPEKIPAAVRAEIEDKHERFEQIFVAKVVDLPAKKTTQPSGGRKRRKL